MRRKQIFPFAVLLCLLGSLTSGCGGFHSYTAITALRNSINQKFKPEAVQIDLQNSRTLAIYLTNSGFEDKPDAEKRAQAQRVAEFTRDHYADIANVKLVRIAFTKQTYVSFFNRPRAFRGSFTFDKDTMREPAAPPPVDSSPPAPTVTYSEKADLTVVSSSTISLYGDKVPDRHTRDAMQLAARFSVPGKDLTEPQTVDLVLIAFVPAPTFGADHHFSIELAGVLLDKGTAEFGSSSATQDGQTAEFMTIRLKYEKFRKLVSGEQAILAVGPKTITLGPEQLHPLRQMALVVEVAKEDRKEKGSK